MARFRVETVAHPNSGLIYAELYYPDDSAVPIANTKPIYASHEDAEKGVLEIFQKWFADK